MTVTKRACPRPISFSSVTGQSSRRSLVAMGASVSEDTVTMAQGLSSSKTTSPVSTRRPPAMPMTAWDRGVSTTSTSECRSNRSSPVSLTITCGTSSCRGCCRPGPGTAPRRPRREEPHGLPGCLVPAVQPCQVKFLGAFTALLLQPPPPRQCRAPAPRFCRCGDSGGSGGTP